MTNLPIGPRKAADLQPILLESRIEALEAYVASNDARITALEHGLAEHQAGAEARLAQIRELEAQIRKTTWRLTHQRPR